MNLVVGIDIGGTKTKIGLVDKEGNCLDKTFFRTQEFPDLDNYQNKIKEEVDTLIAKLDFKPTIIGCGIGAPNASSKRGTIENAANLKVEGYSTFFRKIQRKMGCSNAHNE